MEIKILMPALSPTMTEGNLTKWYVKEGDMIKAGDLIAEVETDKATMEVEAVDEGIVKELLHKEGKESIAVNTPIAILVDENKDSISQKDIKETIELYKEERINFSKMITHKISLSNIVEGFKLVEAANESIKVVVNPDHN